ncbi:hypothetical protein MTO96_019957 [Rhipicephalus appendiculatus]
MAARQGVGKDEVLQGCAELRAEVVAYRFGPYRAFSETRERIFLDREQKVSAGVASARRQQEAGGRLIEPV